MPSRFFIPDELTKDGPDPVSARNAEWAQTFMPSAKGERRVRYKQDIADYAGQLQQQQAAHQSDIMAHDTKAASFLKTQAELDMAREAHQARMQMLPLQMDRLKAQTAADLARQRAALAVENQKAAQIIRESNIAEQSANAQTELDNHYFDTSVSGDVKAARVNALPEKYPLAIHDPSFKERLGQVQKELTPKPVLPDGAVVTGGTIGGQRYTMPGTDSIPESVKSRFDKLSGEIVTHQGQSKTEEAKNAKANPNVAASNVPYSKESQLAGLIVERDNLLKRHPQLAPVATVDAQVIAPEDNAAISWAAANPNDPRAIQIKKLHGVQ